MGCWTRPTCSVLDEYIQSGLPGTKSDAGRWEFDTASAVQWYREYLEKTSSIAESIEEARLRLTSADAALKELKLDQETGNHALYWQR